MLANVTHTIRISLLLLMAFTGLPRYAEAQSEQEFSLPVNPQLIAAPKFPQRSGELRGGGSLTLPFFDDFSRYSLPTNDPAVPAGWQRWSDSSAYLNTHYPVSPPTIGVATLDGLNAKGYPYNFSNEFDQGPADTLTSLPIDLSSFTATDNVYLVFQYQPGGLGNPPDAEDSLVVDFYSPFGPGEWFRQWSAGGLAPSAFQQAFIKVEDPEFFLDGFRFRFRNYATRSGAFDHWHIDYVVVRQGVDPQNFAYDDVAMQFPNYTFLQEYSAMPWTHFISSPSAFMRNNFVARERNLGPTENIVTGFSVAHDGVVQNFPDQDINPFGNAFQEISRIIPLTDFSFDPSVSDTSAVFDVSVYVNPTDLNLQNDTARFSQVFSNYYAYDDGTAERAYAVTSAGASVAVRYRAEVPDTLLGIMFHWLPHGVNAGNQVFLLRVWGESNGQPGSELIENFAFHSPRYYQDGYNLFSFYEFDQPVLVSGNFFVGWTQPSEIGLNVGNDKSTNTNPARLFYRLGIGQPWQVSAIEGSVMVRPVFRAGKQEVWNSVEELDETGFRIYPNPVTDHLRLNWPHEAQAEFVVRDFAGREVLRGGINGKGEHTVGVGTLSRGAYLIQVNSAEPAMRFHQTFIRE
jgi:hypothetical protein